MIPQQEWKWFGAAAHLCVGHWCRFHLATQVGNYLVSTVGEYWPERPVRESHALVHDKLWLSKHQHLRGDKFDAAYMERFGFETIGSERKYETMVFQAGTPCSRPECHCGLPELSGGELDMAGYNTAGDATRGHLAACKKWAKATRRRSKLRNAK